MIKVVLESPYAGNIERNIRFARKCMRDCIMRGEAPIASHLIYTQDGILNDDIDIERSLGIAMGLTWAKEADYAVFYTSKGWSTGMKSAKEFYDTIGMPYVIRDVMFIS